MNVQHGPGRRLPKISVLMSCYNAASFVSEAIESILNQTFTDFEFILIDDGSSDDTPEIAKRYASKDARMKLVEKKNTGLTDSLNLGIRASRGEWIARLDSDDVALATRLEEQVSFVGKSPETLLIGTGFFEIDHNDRLIKIHRFPSRHGALLRNMRRLKRFFPHSSAMFRSDIVKGIGGYNPRILCAEDWDLWLRIAEKGNIACLKKPLVKVRKHTSNISLSDGGRKQLLYGVAATVSHFLRYKGECDPSTDANEREWHSFVNWLAAQIEQERFVERRKEWLEIRSAFFSSDGKMTGGWQLAQRLAKSRNAKQLLHEKVFGSILPATLADQWIRKSVRSDQYSA